MIELPPGYPTEAFAAFAYLKTRERLSVEDLKVLAMIECYGETFYELLAQGVDDAEARALLRRNAAEERGHAQRCVKAIGLLGGRFELPAKADNPFMALAPAAIPMDTELIRLLEQGEIDGDLAYQQWADREPLAQVAQLYRQNGREELRHCERVGQVKARLRLGA
ncbi:MAG TPA: ferritin-like domain-containing protein [Gammaproteobacteria bacterium]|nr:ferritin-like domain-containing protein [Gammaproteobacteria bacterium]